MYVAGTVEQAEQPTHLAEGQIPLYPLEGHLPGRQGPTKQTKRKSKHRSLLQQVGPHHGTYDTTVRQALSSKLIIPALPKQDVPNKMSPTKCSLEKKAEVYNSEGP
eukprot:1137170-Pelagomonas_calceolata.AAC.2